MVSKAIILIYKIKYFFRMDLKHNVNKIHVDLSSKFDVSIEEKSDIKLGNYIDISVTNEGKTVKMIVTKRDLENYKFNWLYSVNPLNENANMVERTSTVDTIVSDISDIFEKNRFSSEYLNELNK